VLKIGRKALGAAYPDFDINLNNHSRLIQEAGRSPETEPLHREALAVFERVLRMKDTLSEVTHESLGADHIGRPN
jgi:hypothetical protein